MKYNEGATRSPTQIVEIRGAVTQEKYTRTIKREQARKHKKKDKRYKDKTKKALERESKRRKEYHHKKRKEKKKRSD